MSSHDKLDEFLKSSSERLWRINALYSRLEQQFSNEEKEAALLSPTERVKYLTLQGKMRKVRVMHAYAEADDLDLHYFKLTPYVGLQELVLDMVPPSTIIDLYELRHSLVTLEVLNAGIPDMSKALTKGLRKSFFRKFTPMVLHKSEVNAPRRCTLPSEEGELSDLNQYKWSKLTTLRLRNCGLCRMDASLQLFPFVNTVDLSHNQISNIVHLQSCHNLSNLDLSHNRVTVLSNLSRVVGNLLRLNLEGNQISNLDGIEKLYALESLDLSDNYIDDESEIKLLARLPCLESIYLEGNPLAVEEGYREYFFVQFLMDGHLQSSGRDVPILDGTPMSKGELRLLRGSLFRLPEDDQMQVSHLDHDYLGNIGGRGSLVETEHGVTDESSMSGSMEVAGSRLSILSDLSMRELGLALGEERSGLLGEPGRRASTGNATGTKEPVNIRQVHQLGGASRTLPARVDPDKFSPSEGDTSRAYQRSGKGVLKTQYEAITKEGLNTTIYVRKANKNKGTRDDRSPRGGRRVVVSISRDLEEELHAQETEVLRLLDETNVRLGEASMSTSLALRGSSGMASSSLSTPSRAIPIRGENTPREDSKEVRSLAGTPQVNNLHESVQEQDQNASSVVAEDTSIENRLLSTGSAESTGFEVGSLGPPSAGAHTSSPTFTSSHQTFDPTEKRDARPSRATSTDLPLDQRMRMMSYGAMSTSGDSSRLSSMDDGRSTIREPSVFQRLPLEVLLNESLGDAGQTQPSPTNATFLDSARAGAMKEGISSVVESKEQGSGVSELDVMVENSGATKSSKLLNAAAKMTAKWAASAQENDGQEIVHVGVGDSATLRTSGTSGEVGETYDDFASSYIGHNDFRRLRVIENLELYCKEQICAYDSCKAGKLFLSWGPRKGDAISEDGVDEVLANKVSPNETFMAIFHETVNMIDKAEAYSHKDLTKATGGSNGKKDRDTEGKMKIKRMREGIEEEREELAHLVMLTSEAIYFIRADTLKPYATFDDAPLLRITRAHALASLRSCTVYFGFQRCALEFEDSILALVEDEDKKRGTGESDSEEDNDAPYCFGEDTIAIVMIIPRDKARTHPLITLIPKTANIAKATMRSHPSNDVRDVDESTLTRDRGITVADSKLCVQIANKDSQLIDAVHGFIDEKYKSRQNYDTDIVHYQMIHQIWRQRPGYSVPRSVVVTSTRVLLCAENLWTLDINLEVLDHSSVSDVHKIITEDDASCVTIVFKPQSFGITHRKWRLRLRNIASASKLVRELRAVKEALKEGR